MGQVLLAYQDEFIEHSYGTSVTVGGGPLLVTNEKKSFKMLLAKFASSCIHSWRIQAQLRETSSLIIATKSYADPTWVYGAYLWDKCYYLLGRAFWRS
jgi:hypothetical protein